MSDLFGAGGIQPSDKLAEVAREVAMREGVYPRQIEAGKMTRQTADRRIAVMRAIEADYTAAAALHRPFVVARIPGFRSAWAGAGVLFTFDTEVDIVGQERSRLAQVQAQVGDYQAYAMFRELRTALSAMAPGGARAAPGELLRFGADALTAPEGVAA